MNEEIFEIIKISIRRILAECRSAKPEEQALAKKITSHLENMSGRIHETINGIQ